MAGLGQLVAGIAHEINNPVGFIYGNLKHANHYVDLLMETIDRYQHATIDVTDVDPEIDHEDLEFIRSDFPKLISSMKTGTDRIRDIVRSLRKFAHHDEADFKFADLHEGIDNTLLLLTHRLKAQTKRPEITLHKQYGTLPKIECFAGALNQVFFNIVSNAIDALEDHGAGTITITTEASTDCILITIADNGKGIPQALQQQIFDPFFTTKPVGSGTGMGLAISHQIVVDKHGGTLECHSILNHGTAFKITLPRNLKADTMPPQATNLSSHSPLVTANISSPPQQQ
ncbi:MAG: ATP-binding protein [Cyanobacteria bacterium J06642_11]